MTSSSDLPRSRPSLGRLAATAVLSLGGVLGLADSADAQRLKMASLVPEGSPWDQNARRMGERWSEEAGVELRIYPGGVAGDEPDILRKMSIGQIDAAMLTTSGLADLDPAFAIFQLPLFFRNDAEVRAVLEAVGPALEARLEEKGFVLLHWGHAGWLRIFSTEPIEDLDDFQRLKQFVWGGSTRMAAWYREVDLQAVPLAATDVLPGLQTGLIEALPSTPLTALTLQWFRSAPNMLERRFAPLLGATIMSERSWKRLNEEKRAAMLAAAQEAGEWLFEEIPEQERKAIAEMTQRGLKVVPTEQTTGPGWDAIAEHFAKRMREQMVPAEIFDPARDAVEALRAKNGRTGKGASGD